MTTCLRDAVVVLPDRLLPGHSVLLDDGPEGRILAVFPDGTLPLPEGCTTVDVGGRYLGPGFVDIHCHGGAGVWAYDDPVASAQHHLRHGTTTMLATTALLPTHGENVAAVRAIADAIVDGRTPTVRGIHMEGPYINPDFGAYREHARIPDAGECEDFVEAAQGQLKAMTIAPELPGTAEMVLAIQRATGGRMVFSVGHSAAAPEQIRALVPAGLRLATHLFNATGCAVTPTRFAGTREAGVDETVLVEDAIVAELIADSHGAHVRPELLQLAVRAKGVDGLVLVTDATAADGASADGAITGGDVNFNGQGELAGSALTMDRAVTNVMRLAGVTLVEAWRMASTNPALAHGWSADVGAVLPGRRGDLVVASVEDGQLHVEQVWLGGTRTEEA